MSSPLRPIGEPRPDEGAPDAQAPAEVGIAPGSRRRRIGLPLGILAGAAAIVALLFATRPTVEVQAPEFLPPLVRVVRVEPQTLRLDVEAEGSVDAAVRSELVSEVAGRIEALGPALVEGGVFRVGDVLLRLDDRDYRVAVEKARAAVERGESEVALADSRLERWTRLEAGGAVSVDQLEEGTNRARVARADLRTARADLVRAELDLERSVLRAPYDGRVRRRSVDRGQFIARGTPIASIYSTDAAEVRLPVPDRALAHLGIPLDFNARAGVDAAGAANAGPGPEVVLRAELAGRDARWQGTIDRVEGEIDPRTRMVTLVARVEDPFGREREAEAQADPPLAPGLFVRARVTGVEVADAVRLPAGALRAGDELLVVEEDRLRFRPVTVLRRERDTILVGEGLRAGEWVCVSPLEAATEGMQVRRATTP